MKATMFIILICTALSAQPLTLRGRVTDLANQPAGGLRVTSAARGDSVFTDVDGRFEILIDRSVLGIADFSPTDFALSEAYPNPGSQAARIDISLSRPPHVSAEIYNLVGQKIRTLAVGGLDAGAHLLRWDLRDDRGFAVSRGVYFFRIVIDGRVFRRKIAALPGSFSPLPILSAPLRKTTAALDLFVSDPQGRYEDKVERLTVDENEPQPDIKIRVNRFPRLLYDGPDTFFVEVGDWAVVQFLIDDDEPIQAKMASFYSENGRIWQITPTVREDGSTTLEMIAGETGQDVVTFIYASGDLSVRADIPIHANPNVTTVRVGDGVTDKPLAGTPLYDEKGIEIGRTGADGKATVVTNDLLNRKVYVGDKTYGWTRHEIPLETLLRNDSFDTYRLGPDFPLATFCWLTSLYSDRTDNFSRPPRQEGDPTVRGIMRGYDPRALDENGFLRYRLVFPLDKTKNYEQIVAQIEQVHADLQRAINGRFGLSLFDLVNNTATTFEENRALYDKFWPRSNDSVRYVDFGAFFIAWTTQTNPSAVLTDDPYPIESMQANFHYPLAFSSSTFEELYTSSAGLVEETKDPRFKNTPFEGYGYNDDVRIPYQGQDIPAKDIIFAPFYNHGQAAPGTTVYQRAQGENNSHVFVPKRGLELPKANMVQKSPLGKKPFFHRRILN